MSYINECVSETIRRAGPKVLSILPNISLVPGSDGSLYENKDM